MHARISLNSTLQVVGLANAATHNPVQRDVTWHRLAAPVGQAQVKILSRADPLNNSCQYR
jgi:hypothetical protein